MNVDDGVESELNRILDSFNWSLLFESFNRVFFFFFSLCVRREVCKIVRQFYHENGKKEREGLHSEKLCDLFWRRNNYSTSDQFVLRDEFSFFVSFAVSVM